MTGIGIEFSEFLETFHDERELRLPGVDARAVEP